MLVGSYIFLLNSENNNIVISSKLMNIQSAENCKGFSETIRQLPDIEDYKFWNWFAGIIDGDGNFDIRINSTNKQRVLKQIRIKLHNRDIRILTQYKIIYIWVELEQIKINLILFI